MTGESGGERRPSESRPASEFHLLSRVMETSPASIILMELTPCQMGEVLGIESHKVEDRLQISISDTGEGMTRETLDRIWSPLFTTKPKALGLACRSPSESWST
jgi:nitrogen-specific signal transduction histidine kinase